jgi:hypothetical protein
MARSQPASLMMTKANYAMSLLKGISMRMKISHIWLGQFGPDAPSSYFEEQYIDDDTLISQFAADQGERFYDHDFVEISFLKDLCQVRTLVDGHSYSQEYLELVVEKASDFGINEANVFVLADRLEFSAPRSVAGSSYRLWYLGEFSTGAS